MCIDEHKDMWKRKSINMNNTPNTNINANNSNKKKHLDVLESGKFRTHVLNKVAVWSVCERYIYVSIVYIYVVEDMFCIYIYPLSLSPITI